MPERAELVQIPLNIVAYFWSESEPYLRQAHRRGHSDSPERLLERLYAEECDLWVVSVDCEVAAAAVTGIRGDTVSIESCGGRKMSDWVYLLAEFESLAKANGKTQIEIKGRKGWSRVLPGYHVQSVVLGKAL